MDIISFIKIWVTYMFVPQNPHYIDTCIWLNLFKKEGDESKGIPYWKIAKDFLEKIMFSDNIILYSGFILKEMSFKLSDDEFKEKLEFMKKEFKFIKATEEDYEFARKLESELDFEISFFDCIHIVISKRTDSVLISRDEELIKNAKKYVDVKKPEELIS